VEPNGSTEARTCAVKDADKATTLEAELDAALGDEKASGSKRHRIVVRPEKEGDRVKRWVQQVRKPEVEREHRTSKVYVNWEGAERLGNCLSWHTITEVQLLSTVYSLRILECVATYRRCALFWAGRPILIGQCFCLISYSLQLCG